MKKILYTLFGIAVMSIAIGGFFHTQEGGPLEALGAASVTYQRTLLPIEATDDIGTTTAPWDDGHFNELCLDADCIVEWPSGGGGGSIDGTGTSSQLAYFTDSNTLSSVATGTYTTDATGLSLNATRGLVGGSAVLSLASGYVIPLSASTTNWNGFYDTPSTRITAGDGIDWTTNTLNVNDVTAPMLSSSDFGDFTCNGTDCAVDSTLLAKNLAWTGTGTTTFAGNLDVAGTVEADVFNAVTVITSSGDLNMGANDINNVGTITTTNASSSNLTVSGNTYLPTLTSALVLAGSNGLLAEYTGIDCTNQFVRDVSATGAGTCASIVSADITDGTIVNDDINSSAGITYSKLSLSNSIVEGDLGIGAPTNDYILIASSSATGGMEWYSPTNIVAILETAIESALDTLSNLVTVVVSTTLQIPFGTTCDSNADGEACQDTTDDEFIIDGKVLPTEVPLYGFQIASTSAKFASSTVITLPPQRLGYTVTTIICSITSGTSKVISLFGESITCDASQEDDGTIASPTVGAGSTTVPVIMGAESGSVDDVNISIFGTWTRL